MQKTKNTITKTPEDLDKATPEQLDLLLAKALGFEITGEAPLRIRTPEGDVAYAPSTQLVQASALIPRYGVNLRCLSISRPGGLNVWGAWLGTAAVEDEDMAQANTPEEAIVRAILATVYLR